MMTEYVDGKLLFKDGDWELRSRYLPDPNNLLTRIWHTCEGYWWYVWTENPVCCNCKKSPPEALVGLKALQDWNR